MRSLFALTLVSMLTASSVLAQDTAAPVKNDGPALETLKEKSSYAIGLQIGADLKERGVDVDPQVLARGIATAIAGEEPVLTEAEIGQVFRELSMAISERQKAAGVKYLEENKAKEGVKVTESGLQYLVVKEGTGAAPTRESRVKVHYRGKKIDGTVFDQSYEAEAPGANDEPAQFGVTQVIKGWTEALQLMKAGAHYRLFIPSDLAYGAQAPPSIGPHQVLIFDVHLLSVVNE